MNFQKRVFFSKAGFALKYSIKYKIMILRFKILKRLVDVEPEKNIYIFINIQTTMIEIYHCFKI